MTEASSDRIIEDESDPRLLLAAAWAQIAKSDPREVARATTAQMPASVPSSMVAAVTVSTGIGLKEAMLMLSELTGGTLDEVAIGLLNAYLRRNPGSLPLSSPEG